MNSFIRNTHTVPLLDLLTLNTAIIIALVCWARYAGYDDRTCWIILGVLLVASILANPVLGVPNNLSYYFGQGERPDGWRGD